MGLATGPGSKDEAIHEEARKVGEPSLVLLSISKRKAAGEEPRKQPTAVFTRRAELREGHEIDVKAKVRTSKAELTLHAVGVQIFEDWCLLISCSRRNGMEQAFGDVQLSHVGTERRKVASVTGSPLAPSKPRHVPSYP